MKMQIKRITKWAKPSLMIIFIIISTVSMFPHETSDKFQTRAKALTKVKTINGDTERTDYVDESGTVTVAADVGYATMITTIKNNSRLEHFYDGKGDPIRRYSGYYGLLREYDEEGRNYHVRYLGIDDLPVMTGYGYSDKYLTFYDNGKIKTEKYYDQSGNAVCTPTYGCGLLNEYDENGIITCITYLNDKDEPMKVGLGYAIVIRNPYRSNGPENGRIESEFYFDENRRPIALSLGQYGVHKEYDENGQESLLTYLDQEGNPIVTNKGYTTVIKTYHADNRTASERYFDIAGNPFSLIEGQFGVKREDDRLVYLDQNGDEILNIKRLLYNQAWIIIPCAIILVIISGLLNKGCNYIIILLYIGIIIYMTLLYRESNESKVPEVLWHYRRLFVDVEARNDILKNIWLFIPLGAMSYKIYPRKRILFFSLGFSCLIEGLQYIWSIGFCELDDIVSNTFGAIIGLLLMLLIGNLKYYHRRNLVR